MNWDWRIPFLVSVVIFGLGIYIRSHLPESAEFEEVRKKGERKHLPVVEAIRRHSREILLTMGLRVAENGGPYIFLAFALAYGKFAGVPQNLMLLGVMLSMTAALATMVMFGALSNRVGRRPVYLSGAVGLMVVAFPFFWLLDTKMPVLVILAFMIGNTICHAAMSGTQPSF